MLFRVCGRILDTARGVVKALFDSSPKIGMDKAEAVKNLRQNILDRDCFGRQ
jgi:hypothetical protein